MTASTIRHLLAIALGLLALAAFTPGPFAPTAQAAERKPGVTVFAAASLKEAMDEAAAAYQREHGIAVRVSYAASSVLARQIEQGAPADVFFPADLDWMDYLQQRGKIDPAARHNLLGNRLVLVAPRNRAANVDLDRPGALAAALGKGRLALGQTSSVPAGKYARIALQSIGAWDGVRSRLAESDSVRAALMLVARGETPLGIVYLSDANAEPAVKIVATFPADSHPTIIYPVAALTGPGQAAGQAFVDWLSSPAARPVFERHGFAVLLRD